MKSQKIDKIQLFNNKNAVILFHKLSPDPKFWKRFTARIQIQKSRYSSDPVQCPSLLTVALRATDFGDVDGLKTCVTYVRRMARIACTPNFALSWPATTPITQSSCVRQSECEIGFHLQVSHFVFRAGAGADENAERTRDHRARLRARDPVPRHHARFHAHGAIHAIALLQLHLPCVEGGRQADCRKSPVV